MLQVWCNHVYAVQKHNGNLPGKTPRYSLWQLKMQSHAWLVLLMMAKVSDLSVMPVEAPVEGLAERNELEELNNDNDVTDNNSEQYKKESGEDDGNKAEKDNKWIKRALIGTAVCGGAVGAVVGGVGMVVAAPLVVGALGFGAGGIAAGSIGASMMSVMAPTVAGGLLATLQSIGAAGFGAAGIALLAGGGGTAGAAASGAGAAAIFNKLFKKKRNAKEIHIKQE